MTFTHSTNPVLRIYLVEDHADTLNTLTRYLESLGHVVKTASTLSDAVSSLAEADCDLLVSDVGLADGDGWELLRRLEQQGAPLPAYAIAMSGYGTEADCARSREAGFRRHLIKPFGLEEFDRALAEATREVVAQRC